MLPLLFVIVTNGDTAWDDDAEEGGEEGGNEGWVGGEREEGDVGGIEEEREVEFVAVIGGGEGVRFSSTVELDRQLWSRSKVPA